MIVLLRKLLSGFAEYGAARTAPGVEASRRAGLLGQLARGAGPAFALRLGRRRLGVRLLHARRRRLGFELGNACVQRLHLCQQFVDALVPGGELWSIRASNNAI
jgi:hypothetical protein